MRQEPAIILTPLLVVITVSTVFSTVNYAQPSQSNVPSINHPGASALPSPLPSPQAMQSILVKARPIRLSDVRLTDGPLKQAQDAMESVLLELEPDRMLAGYRISAGLEPKAEGYGGWDTINARQLTGHVAGHYLSAISLMYTATGNDEFRQRAEYIINEFESIQNTHGDGYLGALMGYRPADDKSGPPGELVDARELLNLLTEDIIIANGAYWEYLNGVWAPWYVYHKTCAGLRDAYRLLGITKALDIEVKFAKWAVSVMRPIQESKLQRVLETEFGGMGEIMVDLYADTGERQWLEASYLWEHDELLRHLQRHEDVMAGKHGNTQMPKLIASIDRFGLTGNATDITAASYFWDSVTNHHTFATGGHGKGEFFGPADTFSEYVDGRNCETCNVYNMLKLTRLLFEYAPSARYADFQERALFNHMLASIDPQNGATSYMVPVGLGVRQEYAGSMTDGSFTCCICSSLESHSRHAEGVYYENDSTLWINIYTPSTVKWSKKSMTFSMDTTFPDGDSSCFTVTGGTSKIFTLAFRRPSWTGEHFAVKVNGEPVTLSPAHWMDQPRLGPGWYRDPYQLMTQPISDYVKISRTWQKGDKVEIKLPKTLHLQSTPDNPNRAAIMWGPLVLAGDLSDIVDFRSNRSSATIPSSSPYPVFDVAVKAPAKWLKPIPGKPGNFEVDNQFCKIPALPEKQVKMTLTPFYRTHRRTYGIYWNLIPFSELRDSPETKKETETQQTHAVVVNTINPGNPENESKFNYRSSYVRPIIRFADRTARQGRGWFSFDIPVYSGQPVSLVITCHSEAYDNAGCELFIDDTKVAALLQKPANSGFCTMKFSVPADLVRGKKKVTLKFQAASGKQIPAIFGVRLLHTDG